MTNQEYKEEREQLKTSYYRAINDLDCSYATELEGIDIGDIILSTDFHYYIVVDKSVEVTYDKFNSPIPFLTYTTRQCDIKGNIIRNRRKYKLQLRDVLEHYRINKEIPF